MTNSTERKGADYAMQAIRFVAQGTRQASARLAIAKAALGPHGNYDAAGRAEWQAYLDAGAPARAV